MNFGTLEDPLLLILTPPPFFNLAILELLQRCIDCVSEDVNAGSALELKYLSCHMFCCFFR